MWKWAEARTRRRKPSKNSKQSKSGLSAVGIPGRCEDLRSSFQQTGAVLFLHLFNRMNSTAKTSEQREFLLDFQQPFLPLPVINMRLRILSPFPAIPLIQFLKLCDFGPKPGNLFAKYLEMLHKLRIAFIRIQRLTLFQAPFLAAIPQWNRRGDGAPRAFHDRA
jgi:hypothetical protein